MDLLVGTSLGEQFCTDINILQDGEPENLESFTVELTSGSPAFITVNPATNVATVNILGDCKANKSQNVTLYHNVITFTISIVIQFQFSENIYDVNEGDGFAVVCLDLVSGVLAASTTIVITPQIGTAGGTKTHGHPLHNCQLQMPT